MFSHTLLLMASWQIKGLQLFASLSFLIILHEFGHYFFAKLFKTRVEKFYLFFDFLFPFSNVLPFSLFKKKIGETIYGIGWFPLGGYVKIAGMVDESMDKDAMALPPQPWEFRSKPAWQRLFIMLGGIIFNIIAAILIYALVFGRYGESYLPTSSAVYGISVDSLGERMGLQDGDKIISLSNKPVERFNKIPLELLLSNAKTIEVERDGVQQSIPIPTGTVGAILKSQKANLMSPRILPIVGDVSKGSLAQKIGLQPGDTITAINQQTLGYWDEFQDQRYALAGQPMSITWNRKGLGTMQQSVTIPKDSSLGIMVSDPAAYLKYKTTKYGFGAAIGKGFSYTWEQFVFYWQQFKMIFTNKEVKLNESLGGIGSFAKIFPEEFSMQSFLMLTAFISIILAFMNLLPIPGLDGGYVFFLLYEMITGRKVSDKVMERATTVGLVLLLVLMVYANGLDIFRAVKK